MKHPQRVEDYLEHMTQAIGLAVEYAERLGSAIAFRQSRRDQDAVIRNIEIIGEAARLIRPVSRPRPALTETMPSGLGRRHAPCECEPHRLRQRRAERQSVAGEIVLEIVDRHRR